MAIPPRQNPKPQTSNHALYLYRARCAFECARAQRASATLTKPQQNQAKIFLKIQIFPFCALHQKHQQARSARLMSDPGSSAVAIRILNPRFNPKSANPKSKIVQMSPTPPPVGHFSGVPPVSPAMRDGGFHMTLYSDSFPAPAAPAPLVRFLADHNPFYVLSACCMLFGVFAINGSLDWSPIPLRNLLMMILTLNSYEVLLILLAIILMRRGVLRDGTMLLLIELFFLADVGFLDMEVFTISFRLGLLINTILLLVAAVKISLIFLAIRRSLRDRLFGFAVLLIGVLLAIPGLLAWIAQRHDDHLHPLAIYAGWWIAGLMPFAYVLLVRNFSPFHRRRRLTAGRGAAGASAVQSASGAPEAAILRFLLVLPMLSIIAHLSLAHWVYKAEFHPLDLSPLLLGIAFGIGRADQFVAPIGWRMRMQLLLPLLAIVLSAIHFPREMIFDFVGITFSPLRVALGAAALVWLDALWMHRRVVYAVAGLSAVSAMLLGYSRDTLSQNSAQLASASGSSLTRLIPQTLGQWGLVSIVAAFVLLALGALLSLHKPRPMQGIAIEEQTGE
jgi:hypothetical protein